MKTWIRILISIGILLFIVFKIGVVELLEVISKANIFLILLALVIVLVTVLIDNFNVYVLLKHHKKVGQKLFTKYNLYAWSISLLLPGRTGDLAVIPFLKKHKISVGESLAAIIMNKLVSILLTIIIVFITIDKFLDESYTILPWIILIGILLGGILLSSKKVRIFIRKKILRKYESSFKGFYSNLLSYVKERYTATIINIVLTFVKIVLGGVATVSIFYALNTPVSLLDMILIFNTATILSFVPFTLSGLGLRETAIVVMLSEINVPLAVAGSGAILQVAIAYLIGLCFSLLIKPEKTS